MPTLTERARAFMRFSPSEEGLKMALAAAQAGIWEWYLDNNESAWSDEVWPLYGLSRSEDKPCFDSWLKSVHPDDRERSRQYLLSAAHDRVPFEAEWRTNPSLGPVRWLLCRGQPARLRTENRPAYTGIVMDITARKNAEHEARRLNESLEQRVAERTAALSEHERLLQNILDGMPGLVGYWNKDLVNRFANKAYIEWFAQDPADIRNKHIREVIGERLFRENLPHMEAALRGESSRFERLIPIPDQPGKHRIAQAHYLPDVANGVVQGFLAIIFDISQIKQAELAAEAANRAKSEFLANISHEVRTPLNAMFGLAQVGARHAAGTPSARTFSQILDSAQHLLTLVNDVLDFSKIEAGKLSLHYERMSLAQVLDHVLALKALQAQAQGLSLSILEAPDVPQYCHGDATRLSQILLNLLANAIRFTEQGQISIRLNYEAPDLQITVSDTGIGMSPEKIAQLFKPFVQVHGNHPSQIGGTGLGLAITKRLIDMMGGQIGVSSEPGRGSTFTVTIPLLKPEMGDFRPLRRTTLIGLPENERHAISTGLTARGCQVHEEAQLPDEDATVDVLVISADQVASLDRGRLARHIGAGRHVLVCAPASANIDLPPELPVTVITGPLSPSRLLNAVGTKPVREARKATQRLQGLHVLAAEDNPVNRLVLEQMLEQEGAMVTFAFDGGHALEQVRVHGPSTFDVMLCDIQMPVMDGYQTAQALSHIAPRLPIIGLTAHAFDTAKQQARKVGMVGYITKPYMLDTLVEEIRRYARKRPHRTPDDPPSAPMPLTPLPTALASDGHTMTADGGLTGSPSPSSTAVDLSDWEAMQQYFQDQPQLLERLVSMLSKTLGDIHDELERALSDHSMEGLAKVAHNIKGTALNLHTPELARLAMQTQEQARTALPEAMGSGRQLSARLAAFISQATGQPLRHTGTPSHVPQASDAPGAASSPQ
ncbi:MAG: ATP-binding protein [Aquabacterium sp.]